MSSDERKRIGETEADRRWRARTVRRQPPAESVASETKRTQEIGQFH